MFHLLPLVETVLLPFLPVEMWSTILRLLDPKSLLAGARSYKLWMAVCRGDPILRQRMRLAIDEEAHLARQFILDPRMSIRVLRTTPATNFGTNVSKVVTTISKPADMVFLRPDIQASKQKKTKKC